MSAKVDAIVIGGSAGALEALAVILPTLPAQFPVPVAVVLHVPPTRRSLLVDVLGARSAIPVVEVDDKQPFATGTLYVAPANYHLLVERTRTFALSVDPPVQYSRPSIDVLFESAADAYGPRLGAVLLSGANDDGAAGLARIREAGGLVAVQDPSTATSGEMPTAAIRLGLADRVLSPAALGTFLLHLGGHV